MNPRFVQLASDPNLIPGVYNYCDQWCSYCALTARCLAYRCSKDRENRHAGDIFKDLAENLNELITFSRDVVQADGGSTTELDELASLPLIEQPVLPKVDDPLERLGRQYAIETSRFLMSIDWVPPPPGRRSIRPSPADVLAWFHVLLAVKIFRALVSAAQAARGQVDRADDANRSAKVALIGIDRSREALRQLGAHDDDARIEHLRLLLDRLEAGLEQRFPDARAFVRPGLDDPHL